MSSHQQTQLSPPRERGQPFFYGLVSAMPPVTGRRSTRSKNCKQGRSGHMADLHGADHVLVWRPDV